MEIQGTFYSGTTGNDAFLYHGVKNEVNVIRSEADNEDCSTHENHPQCFFPLTNPLKSNWWVFQGYSCFSRYNMQWWSLESQIQQVQQLQPWWPEPLHPSVCTQDQQSKNLCYWLSQHFSGWENGKQAVPTTIQMTALMPTSYLRFQFLALNGLRRKRHLWRLMHVKKKMLAYMLRYFR